MKKIICLFLTAFVLAAASKMVVAQTLNWTETIISVNGQVGELGYFTVPSPGNLGSYLEFFSNALMPWYGSEISATAAATSAGAAPSGIQNTFNYFGAKTGGLFFAYGLPDGPIVAVRGTPDGEIYSGVFAYAGNFAVVRAVVPEIDGAFLPQVLLLFGSAFLLFRLRKGRPFPQAFAA